MPTCHYASKLTKEARPLAETFTITIEYEDGTRSEEEFVSERIARERVLALQPTSIELRKGDEPRTEQVDRWTNEATEASDV